MFELFTVIVLSMVQPSQAQKQFPVPLMPVPGGVQWPSKSVVTVNVIIHVHSHNVMSHSCPGQGKCKSCEHCGCCKKQLSSSLEESNYSYVPVPSFRPGFFRRR